MTPQPARLRRSVLGALLLLSMLALVVGAAACGGDDDETAGTTESETTEAAAPDDTVSVQLGENGAKYFVEVDKPSVAAGTILFKIDNVGTIHHEFIVYRTDLEPGELGITDENKADLDEDAIVAEATYATPVRGDPDHRIRDGRGADLTIDLEAGKYVLLCDLTAHYAAGQYIGFTVT